MESKKPINIFQITDTHLFKDDSQTMFGVNTNENFYKVIEYIHEEDKLEPDFFILTGDLSQDKSEASYIKLVNKLQAFNKKIYWIPGNHDNLETMENVFSSNPLFSSAKKVFLKYWDLIFLNTQLINADEGYLSQKELLFLEKELSDSRDKNSISIIMHHHPLKVNTPLIDQFILKNSSDFWEIINKHNNIKLIICGHVHGDYSIKHNGISMECSPATCLQWEKGTTDLNTVKNIGFKVYQLFEDNYSKFVKLWSQK